jgi:hypothetical protein
VQAAGVVKSFVRIFMLRPSCESARTEPLVKPRIGRMTRCQVHDGITTS